MLRAVIRPCIQEQGRTVGCVAARRNVDDGVPRNRSDIGIPAQVYYGNWRKTWSEIAMNNVSEDLVLFVIKPAFPRHWKCQC